MGTETVDWDHIRSVAIAKEPGPPRWPANVRPISTSGLALMGLDERHRLYWDGKPIQLRYKLTLWQNIWAIGVSTAVILGGLAATVQAWVAIQTLNG